MDIDGILQACGLIATFLVFISFLPKGVKPIRWFNLFGCIFFVFYGFGIGAFWTGFMNFCLIFVQIYHLIKIHKEEKKNESK